MTLRRAGDAAADAPEQSADRGRSIALEDEGAARSILIEAPAEDLAGLVRPLLGALSNLSGLESVYVTVFDWPAREEEVRYVVSTNPSEIVESVRIAMPAALTPEAFPGVTRSPLGADAAPADGLVARGLGMQTYISVPVAIGKHRLYGMLCGASRQPCEISETIVDLFESFAEMVAERVARLHLDATEGRAAAAEAGSLAMACALIDAEHAMKSQMTVLRGVSRMLRDRRDDMTDAQRARCCESIVRSADLLWHEIEGLLLGARTEVRNRGSARRVASGGVTPSHEMPRRSMSIR